MKNIKYLGLLLAVIMVMQLAIPMNFVSGLSGTDVTSRIDHEQTKVDVKIYKGTELIEPGIDGKYTEVPIDANVEMIYDFSFLNDDGVGEEPTPYNYHEGDFINVDFPIDIKFPSFPDAGVELKMGEYVVGILTKDGRITFTDFVEGMSNIEVSFQIKGTFKKELIEQENPIEIELWADGEILEIGFAEPEPVPVNLNVIKDGQINAADGEISWTIKVAPIDGKTANNVVLKDEISVNQSFIDGSFAVNGVVTSSGITISSNKFEYKFPEAINKEQVITYKTKITDETYSAENNTNVKVIYNNTVEAFMYDVSKGKATKEVSLDWIDKRGDTVDNYQKIKWTVKINNYGGLLNGKNAFIEDILDSKLLLVKDNVDFPVTIKLDGTVKTVSTTDDGNGRYELKDGKLTYYFNEGADFNTAELTYYTEINNSSATTNETITYYNDAEIRWSTNTSGPSHKAGVGIGKGIIQKSSGGTDAYYTNNEINWTVVINKNRVSITNAEFTDMLPEGLSYKEGTFKLNGITVTPVVSGSAIKYSLGTIETPQTINTPQTITYTTTINNDYKGLFTNSNVSFANNASLSGVGITVQKDSATKSVSSNVISKQALGYDYDTRIAQWKVVVNKNNIPLNNVVITDSIPAGMEFIPGSFKVDEIETKPSQFIVNEVDDVVSKDSFVHNLGNIAEEHVITFETKVKEAYLIETDNLNKILRFENNVNIKAEDFANIPSAKATVDVNNYIVTKTGERTGYEFVKWAVQINKNEVELSNIKLVDALQEGLSLDVSSVKLYEASVDNKGNFTKGSEIDLKSTSEYAYTYNEQTREFVFNIIGVTNKAYQLEFVTDVLADRISINNKIRFEGSGETAENTAGNVYVDTSSWSGSGSAVNGSLSIRKVDKDGALLTGAEFKVYDKTNKVYTGTIENGVLTYKNLPFRTYYIKEVKAPEGYLLDKTVKVVKLSSAEELKLEIINEKALGTIELVKKNHDNLPLEGAEFMLSKGDTTLIEQSDSDGKVIFKDLEPGTYTIKETKAPVGYKLSNEVIDAEVKVNAEQTAVDVVLYLGDTEIAKNQPMVISNQLVDVFGEIAINKTDSYNKPLKGAEFSIYDLSDNFIKTSFSDDEGVVRFENMELGKYKVKETKAPQGYYRSTDVIYAEITRKSNLISTDTIYRLNEGEATAASPIVENESIDITIVKTNEDDKVLEGAEFTLLDNGGSIVQTALSNAFGEVIFKTVPIGEYTIKESKAPSGYYKSETVVDVVVKESDTASGAEVEVSVDGKLTENAVVKNKKIPNSPIVQVSGKIAIKKTDENGKLLSGAWFSLYDENGVALQNVQTIDGIAVFENVLLGKYKIKEVQAPEGYVLSTEEVDVTVEDSHTITLKFTNKLSEPVVKKVGSILINKVDESKKPLKGAEFTLYDENMNVVEVIISDDAGIVLFENLVLGKYFVAETSAPDGYELVSEVKAVEVSESMTYSYKFTNVLENTLINDPDVPSGWENIGEPDVPKDQVALPNTGYVFNNGLLAAIGLMLILAGAISLKKKKISG